MRNLVSVHLETLLVSVKDKCIVGTPRCSGHVESCPDAFIIEVSVGARQVHGLHQTYHRLKLFWTNPMVLLGYEAQLEARFGPFGDSDNLDAR
jgi:hypothetical protein